ncbi:hypothetical protein GOODEAATRI_001461 [Goodea atripinnis]|uniref:Uncharacterized protein n=1 Tax=Goodea atripinnis TaxID=208336 RepID=A0ABV0NQY9_9TELE
MIPIIKSFCVSVAPSTRKQFVLVSTMYIQGIHLISIIKIICYLPFSYSSDPPAGPEPTVERRFMFSQQRGVSPPGPERQRGHAISQDDQRLHFLIDAPIKVSHVQTCMKRFGPPRLATRVVQMLCFF